MHKRIRITILTAFLFCFSLEAVADQKAEFKWPHGAKAAVNLAYDDALDSQLDHALPALNRYGLKGSFYLTLSSETVRFRLDEWRVAAELGHELGNHTIFHPCSGSLPDREWIQPWNDLDRMTVEQLRQHILLANSMLHAIDGVTERTFTAPCADLSAAGEDYLDSIRPEFVAIKSRIDGVTPDMNMLDPYAVGVTAPSGVSGDELIDVVKEAARQGTMANFTFHGVGGDHLSISVEAHEQLLGYLADNRDVYWVDTFLNIMKYVNKNQVHKP